MRAWSSRTAASCIKNRPSTMADQINSQAPATPTTSPTTRTGSQPVSISPIRRAIRIGGSSHSAGSKTDRRYQRQPLNRDRIGDGFSHRPHIAITETAGPTAYNASADSRSASIIGFSYPYLRRQSAQMTSGPGQRSLRRHRNNANLASTLAERFVAPLRRFHRSRSRCQPCRAAGSRGELPVILPSRPAVHSMSESDSNDLISIVNEYRKSLEDCQELYNSCARDCINSRLDLSGQSEGDFCQRMADLGHGLMLKIFMDIASLEPHWCHEIVVLAGELFEFVWGSRLKPTQLKEALNHFRAENNLSLNELLGPFERLEPFRSRKGQVQTVVMRMGNLVAKANGVISPDELRQLRWFQSEMKRLLEPIPLAG